MTMHILASLTLAFFKIRYVANLSGPSVSICREVKIHRPSDSDHSQEITAWLFFAGSPEEIAKSTDLIIDFSGGGFIAMGPLHHEVRLRMWAVRTGKPVLSVAYSKAPECNYFCFSDG